MSRKKSILILAAILLVVLIVILQFEFAILPESEGKNSDLLVGVDAAYGGVKDVKNLVDQVKGYTNVFIIGSTEVTANVTQLQEASQYVIDQGLSLIIFTHFEMGSDVARWINSATSKWGDKFLGVYAYDEAGGRQLDGDSGYMRVTQANNYSDATNQYVSSINSSLTHYMQYYMMSSMTNNIPPNVLTSDYGLYWFDYKAGYNTVLTEFVWNYSRQLAIALDRGAATVQNQQWGVMVDWKYDQPPYIESGSQLYDDLKLAYDNGAKYILVFDSNADHTQGILQEEHLSALKQFWQYTQSNQRQSSEERDRVAYVLPKDYGYGFRGPTDRIWGLFPADNLTNQIGNGISSSLEKYGTNLDVIYDDGLSSVNTTAYNQLIFWNSTQ